MPRLVLFLLLGLAACAEPEAPAGPVDMQGWRFASGKPPTRAEYAAIVAACQDGAVKRSQAPGSLCALDACLADLGLKRAP